MKKFILIVEDDDTTANLISKIFTAIFKCKVAIVDTNEQALKLIKKEKPILITSDIYHPGGTGIELFRFIRNNKKTENIPFIIISGNVTPEQELKLFRSGIEGVFKKPFTIESLAIKIKKYITPNVETDDFLIDLNMERADLDYKELIDFSMKKNRAALAKDVIAMYNSGGGAIIIGIAETKPGIFTKLGIDNNQIPNYEITKLNDALYPYLKETISISSKTHIKDDKTYIIIKIPSITETLAMSQCDNKEAKLFKGRIYYRTESARCCEARDSYVVTKIIERIVNYKIQKIINPV